MEHGNPNRLRIGNRGFPMLDGDKISFDEYAKCTLLCLFPHFVQMAIAMVLYHGNTTAWNHTAG
jgi:hypothetical protein